MAYDANPDATHVPTTNVTVPTALLTLYNADLAAIGAAWTSFTPAWTNLTVGNGTQSAAYILLGKSLRIRAQIVLGSTSSVGTDPSFTLPGSTTAAGTRQIVVARAFDSSAVATYSGTGQVEASGTLVRGLNFAGSTATATATVPFTWATGDIIDIQADIEVA